MLTTCLRSMRTARSTILTCNMERNGGPFSKRADSRKRLWEVLHQLIHYFDLVMKQFVCGVESGAGSLFHYLGKNIQQKLMDSTCSQILEAIVKAIKTSKYFSIILECTPDPSHEEQLSVIVRILTLGDTSS